jgi:release factor glutamine methyltransferase
VVTSSDRAALVARFSTAGFLAPEEEADDLLEHAAGDAALLGAMVARRLKGEPMAWVTGHVQFCDIDVRVDPGVYVPRPQSQLLAIRAAALLPGAGVGIDLCTGSGAIAKVLATTHPQARVVASDIDERAIACALSNGVEAWHGDLFSPLPASLAGLVDLVVGIVPYVPTPALSLLQRDTLAFESPLSYDGGPDGTDILRRVLTESPRFLRPGGVVLLELGGEQADDLETDLSSLGYDGVIRLMDDESDIRGIEARWGSS